MQVCHWPLTLKQQNLFVKLSNPLFSNKFSFHQWLPYISLQAVMCAIFKRLLCYWILFFLGLRKMQNRISLCNFLQLSSQDVARIIESSFTIFLFFTLIVKIMGATYLWVPLIHKCSQYYSLIVFIWLRFICSFLSLKSTCACLFIKVDKVKT